MLNSIRRHPHTDTEDYRCSRCDTPLLRANSVCPSCTSNTNKPYTSENTYQAIQDYDYQVETERQKEAARQSHQTTYLDPTEIIYGEPISHYAAAYGDSQRIPGRKRPSHQFSRSFKPNPFQSFVKKVSRSLSKWVNTQQDRLQQMPNPNEDWLASPLSMRIHWGSWQELTIAMLWVLGGLGLIIGTLRLYALDGFQAMVLFQFSGLVFLATSAYRKIQNIEKIQRRLLLHQEQAPYEIGLDSAYSHL